MVTCQAVIATEQHLAQHRCFHDSCMKTHLRPPSDIKCSYKEAIMTTLQAANKIRPTQPHPVKNSISTELQH